MKQKTTNPIFLSWLRGWKFAGRLVLLYIMLSLMLGLTLGCGSLLLFVICGDNENLYLPLGILLAFVFVPFVLDIIGQSSKFDGGGKLDGSSADLEDTANQRSN